MKINKFLKRISFIGLIIMFVGLYSAYAMDDRAYNDGGIIRVEGKVDNGEANQIVAMVILQKEKTSEDFFNLTDYSEIDSIVANIQMTSTLNDGSYSFFTMIDENYLDGKYNIIVDGGGMETPKFLTVQCISLSRIRNSIEMLNSFDSDTSFIDIHDFFQEYYQELNLDSNIEGKSLIDDYNKLSESEQSIIHDYIIERDYNEMNVTEGLQNIKVDFGMSLGLQLMNNASTNDEVRHVIEKYNEDLALNLDVYNKYEEDLSYSSLFQNLYSVSFESTVDLQEVFHKQSIISFLKTSNMAGAIRDVLEEYSEDIGIDISANSEYKSVDSVKLYSEFMKNRNFNDYNGVRNAINEAISKMKQPVTKPPSGGGGGGSVRRESFSVGSTVTPTPNITEPEEEQEIEPFGFGDIQGHWAEEDINFMYSKGYIKGIDEKTYAPDLNISRAQFVSIIVRVLGLGEEQENIFTDINNQWYNIDINKAAKAGLVSGHDGKFRPEDPITRQELMKIVVDVYKYKNQDYTQVQKELPFEDKVDIADWAVEYVSSAIELELIKGINKNGGIYINPAEYTTRSEAAVILRRLVEKI